MTTFTPSHNRVKEDSDSQDKKDQGFIQTQSTIRQMISRLSSDQDDLNQVQTPQKRKGSFCSLASQNIFQELEEIMNLKTKKKGMDIQNNVEISPLSKEKRIKWALIKQLVIISSSRILPQNLIQEMTVYSYDKPKRMVFGESEDRLTKHRYYTQLLLMDLYNKYGSNPQNKFYFLYNKCVFFFHYDKIESNFIMMAFSPSENLSQIIDSEGIQFQRLPLATLEGQMVMIRNRNINVFWNLLLNQASKSDEAFEVASNFQFSCCSQLFPREVFNGRQNRPEVKKSRQFCNKKQVYQIRLQGLLLEQNIKKMSKKLKQNGIEFIFQFKYVQGTSQFHRSITNYYSSAVEEE